LTDIYLHLSSVELARAVAQDEVCTTVYQLVCLRVHRRYEFDPPAAFLQQGAVRHVHTPAAQEQHQERGDVPAT